MSLCMSPSPKATASCPNAKGYWGIGEEALETDLSFSFSWSCCRHLLSWQPSSSASFSKSRGAQLPSCAAYSLRARVHAAFKGTAINKAQGGESWAGFSTGFSTVTVLTLNAETVFQSISDVLVAGGLILNLSQLTGQKVFFSLTSICGRSTKVCFKMEMFP